MNQTITKYDQYPHSQFPENVDNWDNMQDLNAITAPLALEYNTLLQNKKYSDAANYIAVHPELDKTLFNAAKINRLMDGLKATQQFFKDDVAAYIKQLSDVSTGINDNITMDDIGANENVYSIAKVNELLTPETLSSTFDVNTLIGETTKFYHLYSWSADVAAQSVNLPHGVTDGILQVIRDRENVTQVIFSNNQIFYRTSLRNDITISKWSKLNNNRLISISLLSNNWIGTEAPYTQTVSVDQIVETDEPILVSLLSEDANFSEQKAYMKAFEMIASGIGTTADGTVTFKVFKKPAIDITIGLKGA